MSNQQGPFQLRQFPGQPMPGTDGNYDTSGMFYNPAGTLPFPAPTVTPYPQWQSARTSLHWSAPSALDAGYATVGYWQSPLYDLRPEIRSADGSRSVGVPIWGASFRKLWIQIDGLLSASAGVVATDNLKVVTREYGNIFDAQQIARITADSEVTADVSSSGTNQPPSVILNFAPPGSGMPVRYWRLEIAFQREDRLSFPLAISGAFY